MILIGRGTEKDGGCIFPCTWQVEYVGRESSGSKTTMIRLFLHDILPHKAYSVDAKIIVP
jgi:lipopolysaccharide biosynthesis glycosyltransferase